MVTCVRRAMKRTDMSLNVNGLSNESQLSDDLQAIIAKHRDHFDGQKVKTCAVDIEIETESEDE